jgi:hypothetical protein
MTDENVHGKQINELVKRARAWLRTATPADLWHVLQHGDIDARVGLAGVDAGLGYLSGPEPNFLAELRSRGWLPQPEPQDLAAWFAADQNAQQRAVWEIQAELSELFFDLGEWEWVDGKPWGEPAAPAA